MVAAPAKPVPRDLLFALDTPVAVPISPDEAYIRGWFIPPAGMGCELEVQLENERIPVFTGLRRQDVARHYANNPVFKYSGFVAHLARRSNPVTARLFARGEQFEFVLAEDIAVPPAAAEPASENPLTLPDDSLITLLIPMRGGSIYPVTRSVESVRRQSYSRWQICLIGQTPDSFKEIPEIFRSEPRIAFGEEAAQANGKFILYMDAGDELGPGALAQYVSALEGGADIVYSDECQIDVYGERGRIWAKPDFDAEAYRSWNFIGRGVVLRRSLLEGRAPGPLQATRELLGSIDPKHIRHIARVLYYSRSGDNAAWVRESTDESVEGGLFPGSVRIRHALPPGCTIALILRPQDGLFQEAVLAPVLDRGMSRVYRERTAAIRENVVIFINGPLESVNHSFLEELAGQALRPDVGLVTGIALDRQGRILSSGLRRNAKGELQDAFVGLRFADPDLPRESSVVRSADAIVPYFFAVRRDQLSALQSGTTIAAASGLRTLVTPYAIATFDMMSEEAMAENQPGGGETLEQMASERNYLRRELANTREELQRLEKTRCTDWKARVEDLERELKEQERLQTELLNSLSWRLTRPLRACMRLVRGK
ncbi:MAG TPA: hypothetical protein VKX25_10840 [Bryobacteraceae bacterium]|jgi:hypothetical protein|nr:hypothetical protein [Bryobacteraceae bacterium]